MAAWALSLSDLVVLRLPRGWRQDQSELAPLGPGLKLAWETWQGFTWLWITRKKR